MAAQPTTTAQRLSLGLPAYAGGAPLPVPVMGRLDLLLAQSLAQVRAREQPTRVAMQTALGDVEHVFKSERGRLATAYAAERAALQTAGDVQAALVMSAAVTEQAKTLATVTERENRMRATFLLARGTIFVAHGTQVALARNDTEDAIARLRDGTQGLGQRTVVAAHAEGQRGLRETVFALERIRESGESLKTMIDTTQPALPADLDNDEKTEVASDIKAARSGARGGVAKQVKEADDKLREGADGNEDTFVESANDIAKKLADQFPGTEKAMRDAGGALVANIDEMAATQLAQIDDAEHHAMEAMSHARVKASNVVVAAQATVADLRIALAMRLAASGTEEAAMTNAIDGSHAQARNVLTHHQQLTPSHGKQLVASIGGELHNGVQTRIGALAHERQLATELLGSYSATFTQTVTAERDQMTGRVDALIDETAIQLATASASLTGGAALLRTTAIMAFTDMQVRISVGVQPELDKAKAAWRDKTDELVTSVHTYETEALAKHGQLRAQFPAKLQDTVDSTVERLRRSTARKIWDGVKSGFAAIGKGLAWFALGVVAVAAVIVIAIGAEFLGLALAIGVAIAGIVMLSIGLIHALATRFKQLWNNDWPWWGKILGVPAALGVAVGDVLGISQIVEGIRGKELISERKLSAEERSQLLTIGAFQLATLGLAEHYLKADGAAPTEALDEPPVDEPAGAERQNEPAGDQTKHEPSDKDVDPNRRQSTCFVPGTPVHTPAGIVAIESLRVGDRVFGSARAGDASATIVAEVVHCLVATVDRVLDLDFGIERITCSPEHPFFVVGAGWITAGQLHVGALTVTREGPTLSLRGVRARVGSFTVHNIEVDSVHDYFVGRAGVLVHNKAMRNFPIDRIGRLLARIRRLPARTAKLGEIIEQATALEREIEASENGGQNSQEGWNERLDALERQLARPELVGRNSALLRAAKGLLERIEKKVPDADAQKWELRDRARKIVADLETAEQMREEGPNDGVEGDDHIDDMQAELDKVARELAELEHEAQRKMPPDPVKTPWQTRLERMTRAPYVKHLKAKTEAQAKEFSKSGDAEDAAQYWPKETSEAAERDALERATPDDFTVGSPELAEGQIKVWVRLGRLVGYDAGEAVESILVELTSGDVFHGHPRKSPP